MAEFPRITPDIVVHNAKEAIDFYQRAFGAEVIEVMETPDGKVMNAQLKFGDSMLMLNDEFPDFGALGAKTLGANPVTFHLMSQDVDSEFQRAVDAGCHVTMPLADMFWGDRYGALEDPFGYKWSMGQSLAELGREAPPMDF